MKKHPLISVITPSYNQGRFIKETIDSVLTQDYPNIELLVMDGGSNDETVAILKSYGKKITWTSKKDKGQTDAINKGMKLAKGEIVCYLNSDDTFLPGTLAAVAEAFKKYPNIHWLTGDYQIINENGTIIQSYIQWYKTTIRAINNTTILYILNYINQPSTFWKRSLFESVGYFDESLRYCMDYDFWLRLSAFDKPLLLSRELSQFRIHSLSKGGSQYEKQFEEEYVVAKKYNTSPVLLLLHKLHAFAIVQAYKLIK